MARSWESRRPQRSAVVPPPDDGTISSLLEAALAAASDDLQWPAFLEALSSQLGASTMSLFLSDPVGQRSSIQFAAGKDPSYVKAYNEHFATVSPFFGDWSHERWREGVIELSGQVCPDRVLLRTEYYNDWLRPQKIPSSCPRSGRSRGRGIVGAQLRQTEAERVHHRPGAGAVRSDPARSAWSPSASPSSAGHQVGARCGIGRVRCAPDRCDLSRWP